MFTGLVSDVGRIVSAEGDARVLRRYVIETMYPAMSIPVGASIACSGICLTAVTVEANGSGSLVTFEAASETLERTLAGAWAVGTHINLERSLRVGDELGGHLVTGHVDGIAVIAERSDITDGSGPWGATAKFRIDVPPGLARFIAEKGSICLDGVSLTVNSVSGASFSVLLIPHTLAVTTFGSRKTGDRIHVEVDLMARYAARLTEAGLVDAGRAEGPLSQD
jgi:riboflavin synthase